MDHAARDVHGGDIAQPAKLLGENLHRVLVDLAEIEIDGVDPERFLDEHGDLVEGEHVTVDQRLRDVRLLLHAPPANQLGRNPWHGPYQGDQPLVLEAEFSLVGLRISRYRHGFRWDTSLLLLYGWQAALNDCFYPPKITRRRDRDGRPQVSLFGTGRGPRGGPKTALVGYLPNLRPCFSAAQIQWVAPSTTGGPASSRPSSGTKSSTFSPTMSATSCSGARNWWRYSPRKSYTSGSSPFDSRISRRIA